MWKLLLLAAATVTTGTVAAQPIRNLTLEPERAVELPVSRDITTVMFPGPITAVAGADMLIDAGKGVVEFEEGLPVRFQVTHSPGSNFILIRSVQPDAQGRLTAIFEGSAYVLNLQSVGTNSVASLIFRHPSRRPAKRVEAPPEPPRFNPHIGLSLLDRARAYPVLTASLPQAVAGVTRRSPNRRIELPDLEITVEEVYRFPKEDALVFLLKLHNPTDRVVDVAPNTFAVRVAQERFEQAIATGPHSLGAGETANAEFAIVGMPDGTRNDLSVDNAFTVLVSSARRPEEPPPAAAPPTTSEVSVP